MENAALVYSSLPTGSGARMRLQTQDSFQRDDDRKAVTSKNDTPEAKEEVSTQVDEKVKEEVSTLVDKKAKETTEEMQRDEGELADRSGMEEESECMHVYF